MPARRDLAMATDVVDETARGRPVVDRRFI